MEATCLCQIRTLHVTQWDSTHDNGKYIFMTQLSLSGWQLIMVIDRSKVIAHLSPDSCWSVSCSCGFALPERHINEIILLLSSESCLFKLAKCTAKLPMWLSVSVLYSLVLMNSISSYEYTTIISSSVWVNVNEVTINMCEEVFWEYKLFH